MQAHSAYLSNFTAVSYTHLDVYKRQEQRGDVSAAEQHFRAALNLGRRSVYLLGAYADFLLDQNPVSYTHLDVYKRQGVSTAPQMASIWQFGVTLVQGNMVAEAGPKLDFDFKQYAG